jgi:hypothetical protein
MQPLWGLLLSMPADGTWAHGRGEHCDTLVALLDEGTLLVEEIAHPVDCLTQDEWLVRLTAIGLIARSAIKMATENGGPRSW